MPEALVKAGCFYQCSVRLRSDIDFEEYGYPALDKLTVFVTKAEPYREYTGGYRYYGMVQELSEPCIFGLRCIELKKRPDEPMRGVAVGAYHGVYSFNWGLDQAAVKICDTNNVMYRFQVNVTL